MARLDGQLPADLISRSLKYLCGLLYPSPAAGYRRQSTSPLCLLASATPTTPAVEYDYVYHGKIYHFVEG